jgi:hypothetical protein
LTEEEKLALIVQSEKDYLKIMADGDKARNRQTLDSFQSFLGDVQAASALFGKKGAKIAKAAAIASATITMYDNAVKAYGRGLEIPYIGAYVAPVFAAAAIAAGAANIAKIQSTSNAGNYATGGIIGGSSYQGDNLTANVNSGEMILNRNQQKKLFDTANGKGASSGAMTVNVHNYGGAQIETRESTGEDGARQLDVLVKQVLQQAANDIHAGRGPLPKAFESVYPMKRGRVS